MTQPEEEWFVEYCAEMEHRVGRGWKRRLAEKVGVSETNVQTWLKSGRVPPAVRKAIEQADELADLKRQISEMEALRHARWIEESENSRARPFTECTRWTRPRGRSRLVAGSITSLRIAREIANLPEMQRRIGQAFDALMIGDRYDHPDDRRYVEALQSPGWDSLTSCELNAKAPLDDIAAAMLSSKIAWELEMSRETYTLTPSDAAAVKGMLKRGDKGQDIAAYFGVNSGRISDVKTGITFSQVPAQVHDLPRPGPYDIRQLATENEELRRQFAEMQKPGR